MICLGILAVYITKFDQILSSLVWFETHYYIIKFQFFTSIPFVSKRVEYVVLSLNKRHHFVNMRQLWRNGTFWANFVSKLFHHVQNNVCFTNETTSFWASPTDIVLYMWTVAKIETLNLNEMTAFWVSPKDIALYTWDCCEKLKLCNLIIFHQTHDLKCHGCLWWRLSSNGRKHCYVWFVYDDAHYVRHEILFRINILL